MPKIVSNVSHLKQCRCKVNLIWKGANHLKQIFFMMEVINCKADRSQDVTSPWPNQAKTVMPGMSIGLAKHKPGGWGE